MRTKLALADLGSTLTIMAGLGAVGADASEPQTVTLSPAIYLYDTASVADSVVEQAAAAGVALASEAVALIEEQLLVGDMSKVTVDAMRDGNTLSLVVVVYHGHLKFFDADTGEEVTG